MDGYGRSKDGFGIDREDSVLLIVRTALQHGVEDPRQIAYMLATAQHETRDFSAPEEDFGRSQARKLGYSGGEEFFGRGFVHLTHDYNYRKFDELFGLGGDLVTNPERAREPELAARILVIGMRDGLFTGRRVDRYINDETRDTYNARRVVNGITAQAWTRKAAEDCEKYAEAWEQSVPALIEQARARMVEEAPDWRRDLERALDRVATRAPVDAAVVRNGLPDYLRFEAMPQGTTSAPTDLRIGARGEHVATLQRDLDRLGIRDGRGRPLVADGVFGPATRQAVENFQLWSGLETTGVVDRQVRDLLREPRDPAHPDHAMYARIRAGVRAVDEGQGRPYDEASERISRCLLARCKGVTAAADAGGPTEIRVALRRVDHVVLGGTGHLFAIEGALDDPAQRRVRVPLADAARVPVDESDRGLAVANVAALRERDHAQHQAPTLQPRASGHDMPGMALQ